jgi:anti-anti-sigma factor
MKYVIEENEDTVLLKIEEDLLNTQNSEELKSILNELYTKGYKTIEIDLSKVKATNSSGIGKILFFYKKLSEEGGSLKIKAINPELRETFELLRLDKLFGI